MSDCSDDKASSEASQTEEEKTLIIIKPDAVRKKLIGEIISRFEREGFVIEQLKMMKVDKDLACTHYLEHKGRPYFDRLINYITSDRCVAMVVSRDNAISRARKLMGCTDSTKAEKGTIRGDFGEDVTINVVHGSDCLQSAKREIKLFFGSYL